MTLGILGTKLGMTQIFHQEKAVPVTLIKAGPCPIVQIKTPQKDGYSALQLGFVEKKRVKKPLLGHFKNITPTKYLKEVKVENIDDFRVGDVLTVNIFKENEFVDVTGITKGKGFQGVVKRHNFKGGPKTHGQSDKYRSPGSIGSQRPQRVLKGKKMPGHMGYRRKTVQNLQILKIDQENNLLFIKGSVPGPKNSLLVIKKAIKKIST